jgi:DNA-binding GntR family transcriptional regulator
METGAVPAANRTRLKVDRRKPAAEQVYLQLRERIVRLVCRPREPLYETVIAEEAGISRTPVREALQRLRDEGLVEIFPGLGTFVTPLDSARLHEAIRIRKLLEGEAAATAASLPECSSTGQALLRIVEDQAAAFGRNEAEKVYDLDAEFHRMIFVAANLPTMWGMVRVARANMDRVHYLSLHLNRGPLAVEFHREIAKAIANGDADAARDAMQRHIESNGAVVEGLAAHRPEYLAQGEGK